MSQIPLFELSQHETLATLRAIHRGEGSYVGFARKDGSGGFENLFSLQIAEIQAMFPALAKWLLKDAYFTVNGMYRAAPFESKTTGLPAPWRQERHLKYLNASYVDLDVGRETGTPEQRVTWRAAAAALGEMMDEGLLPQSSLFARSGRGIYVFWLLRDENDPSQPPAYGFGSERVTWRESLALYKNVQRHIARRLAHLAADLKAIDAARVLRVPGTMHSTAGEPATYMVQMDAEGKPYTYTLSELARFFGVRDVRSGLPDHARAMVYGEDWAEEVEADGQSQRQALPVDKGFGRAIANRGSAPARKRGAQVRGARRAQDLATLEQWRGGWGKGRRAWHLSLYAGFLRESGSTRSETMEAVSVMASNCRPAYPSEPNDKRVDDLVAEAFRGAIPIPSNEKLCKWLGITPELCRELELLSILPAQIKAEMMQPPGGAREAERQARLDFIRAHVAEHGELSARRMLDALEVAGFKTNRQTVNDDLRALGYGRAPSGRRKAHAEAEEAQPELPL